MDDSLRNLSERKAWKKGNLCLKGDTSTTVTQTNVLVMMRDALRNAPKDEESVEMNEALHSFSLTSSQDKGSGQSTSEELSVTPAPPDDITDSSSSSKPSTPNKKVIKQCTDIIIRAALD